MYITAVRNPSSQNRNGSSIQKTKGLKLAKPVHIRGAIWVGIHSSSIIKTCKQIGTSHHILRIGRAYLVKICSLVVI